MQQIVLYIFGMKEKNIPNKVLKFILVHKFFSLDIYTQIKISCMATPLTIYFKFVYTPVIINSSFFIQFFFQVQVHNGKNS